MSGGPFGVGLSLAYAAETLADLPRALDEFERLDLDAVEIFLPSLAIVLGGRTNARRLSEIKRICAGRAFRYTLHGPLTGNFALAAAVDAHRDAARACLEVGAEIGAEVLVWHAGISPACDAEAALDVELDTLGALAPEAAGAECALSIETMYCRDGEVTATPSELAWQLEQVAHPYIGATIDFSHAALNCAARQVDLLDELRALAPYARHLHIHDSFARPVAFRLWSRGCALTFGQGDLHLPPGEGSLPWRAFAELPWTRPLIANLELNQHWRADWVDAIAWTRRWAAAACSGR